MEILIEFILIGVVAFLWGSSIFLPLIFWCQDLYSSRMIEDNAGIRLHLRKLAYISQTEKINWKEEGF